MDLNKVLQIKVGGEIFLDYKDLHPLQGHLKSITKDDYHKLIQSLKKNGMPVALNIWVDTKGKKWISDGHHRCLAFGDMEKDGWFIPPIPCNIVKAKTKKEAAALLLIGNSTYAHITQESLSSYMIDQELSLPDLEFLDLPDLDMRIFNLEQAEFNPDDSSEDNDTPKPEKKCPHCGEIL